LKEKREHQERSRGPVSIPFGKEKKRRPSATWTFGGSAASERKMISGNDLTLDPS